jgi:hypothetical protein
VRICLGARIAYWTARKLWLSHAASETPLFAGQTENITIVKNVTLMIIIPIIKRQSQQVINI